VRDNTSLFTNIDQYLKPAVGKGQFFCAGYPFDDNFRWSLFMNMREAAIHQWLGDCSYSGFNLEVASADASFRQYWRMTHQKDSYIVMDAPPEKESCDAFIHVDELLRQAGLSAPEILEQDLQQGFLLLTDFGCQDYLGQLNPDSENKLYSDAIQALLQMQTRIATDELPGYGEPLLNREMDLFHGWFLGELLDIRLTDHQSNLWQSAKKTLIANALQQPEVFVHRDFHSRNLMKIQSGNPAILDFQDAVKGPLTYDLVSLLRDCYIEWPVQRVESLAKEYYKLAREKNLLDVSHEKFIYWFNLMGIQRHLKAVGIFSRLNIRDGKPGYLKDIPRTLNYVISVGREESSMSKLVSLMDELDIENRILRLL
jgi:aminoglycoside/choline kinase family phosphotransferase